MITERPKPHIEVTPHGPREVSGDIPLRPKTIVRPTTAAKNTYAERAEIHEGPGIELVRDPGLCHHAGFCTNKVTTWFDMVPGTDYHQARVQLI